jgi:hypothetical protein
MSLKKVKTFQTVRGKDLRIRYTKDNLVDILIVQRQFYDQSNQILSPITPKLLERQVIGDNSPARLSLKNAELRHIIACFGSVATVLGESNFKVIIPYAPTDPNHKEQLREIFNYVSSSSNLNPPSALNISYHGENVVN